ncbi:putative hydrolase of the HAD superfamily [Larkinella arboricola]|uniref:Putative hydrolase of the HAD superfamily n=1 Tax=Larkinella arboricola TaxID=643671 RepID=A0A327WKV5_LARAB|nr:HAD family hydrolase [Larkinella arboricola]RAJ92539.1 putative hydrolase of the HAD superfamily [Larkinella arboricola]
MIQGLLFDYGGTIDTNGLHWGGVLWARYQKYSVPVDQAIFNKAYAFGERALAINPLVKPNHTFYEVLRLKIDQQFQFLTEAGFALDQSAVEAIAADCNAFARQTVAEAKPILLELAKQYPLVMVSNFYGNLNTVLDDFGIRSLFQTVIESAVVGVRKPDPAIYQLGVDYLQLPAGNTVVIGDSYTKDIQPAHQLGCRTVWLNVAGWEDTPRTGESRTGESVQGVDAEITDFAQLPEQLTRLSGKAAQTVSDYQ